MRPLRAVVLGQNSLLVECGQILLDRGWAISGLVSPSAPARRWAAERGIAGADPTEPAEFLSALRPFDYLFSITNLRMLPADVLAMPERLAINFHDALLPRDAGMHASAWAIAQQTRTHGVTWHVMAQEADAGDILAQRMVPVGEADTNYDLNVACHHAGLASFTELVDDLAAGRESRTAQDLAQRTYHPRWARPDAALTISWREPAAAIAALVRATAFGPHPNEFGTAKLLAGRDLLVVGEAEPCQTRSGHRAGTVLAATGDAIKVATRDHDLWLRRLTTSTGTPYGTAIRRGDVLVDPAPEYARELAEEYGRALRHERFWVRRLRDSTPVDVPLREHTGQTGELRLTTSPPATCPLWTVLMRQCWPRCWPSSPACPVPRRSTSH